MGLTREFGPARAPARVARRATDRGLAVCPAGRRERAYPRSPRSRPRVPASPPRSGGDALVPGVPPAAEHPAPATITSPRPCRAGEHQRVEKTVGGHAKQRGFAEVGHQCVGARARLKAHAGSPAAAAPRRRPARTGARPSKARPPAALRSRCAGAAQAAGRSRASAVPPARRARRGCRADRERHAGVQPARQIAKAVPRLASVVGQITAAAPLFATASISAGTMCVACTSCQRRSSRPSFASHSIGRAPVACRQSSTSAVCSATWMWIGPAKPSASRRSSAIDSGAAARSEWIASPALTSGRPPASMARAACQTSAAPMAKRRWSSRSRGWRIRRARTAPAAASGRCPPRRRVGQRPRQRERILVRAAVAVVLQVVELAHLRVAAASSSTYSCAATARSCSGRCAERRVHAVAPRPEVVAPDSRRSASAAKARWKAWLCASTSPGSSAPASTCASAAAATRRP